MAGINPVQFSRMLFICISDVEVLVKEGEGNILTSSLIHSKLLLICHLCILMNTISSNNNEPMPVQTFGTPNTLYLT